MNVQDEEPIASPPGLRDLVLERSPPNDLWPGIESRIGSRAAARPVATAAPARRRSWLPLAAAASFVLAVAALVSLQVGPLPSRSPASAPADEVPLAWQTTPAVLQHDNRGLVKANLKMINSAESQLRQAMSRDPNAAYLQRLMLTTQDQQQHLHKLLNKGTHNTDAGVRAVGGRDVGNDARD
jgi:hypothetical protein